MFSCCNFNINYNRDYMSLSSNRSTTVSRIEKETKSNPMDDMIMDDKVYFYSPGVEISSKVKMELFEHSLRGKSNTPKPIFCEEPEQKAWLSLAAAHLKSKFNRATEGVNHFEELKNRGYNDYEFLIPELLHLTMIHLVNKMYAEDTYSRDLNLSGYVEKFTPVMNKHLNMIEVYVCEKLNWDLRLNDLEEMAHRTKTAILMDKAAPKCA